MISRLFTSAFCLSLALGFVPLHAFAQESGEAPSFGSEYSFHLGSLLPDHIRGVTEIMPTVGVRYAYNIDYGALEAGIASSHSHGVDYKILSGSYRGELPAMTDLLALFYIGPDFHYYTQANSETHQTKWGFHVGTGMEMHLGGPFWLRGDMKFNMNPGTALYIGFGFAIRTPGGGGGGGN